MNELPDSIGQVHSSKCDRHLSRIAREIVQNDIIPILRIHMYHLFQDNPNNNNNNNKNNNNNNNNYFEYWNLLPKVLEELGSYENHKCILNPNRDILRHHELHSKIIPSPRQASNFLHQCTLCGKKFASQYYLDKHMDLRHSHEIGSLDGYQNFTRISKDDTSLSSTSSDIDFDSSILTQQEKEEDQYWICAARDLCPILAGGDHACEEIAMANDYYGPGNGFVAKHFQHYGIYGHHKQNLIVSKANALHNLLHPYDQDHHYFNSKSQMVEPSKLLQKPVRVQRSCHDSTMNQYRNKCYIMIDNCFGKLEEDQQSSNVSSLLRQHLCDRLTCSQKIHILAGHSIDHIHAGKDEWDNHHDFGLGFMGILMIISIFTFYFLTSSWGMEGGRRRISTTGDGSNSINGMGLKKRKTL